MHFERSAPGNMTTWLQEKDPLTDIAASLPWLVGESKLMKIFRPSSENIAFNKFGGIGGVDKLNIRMDLEKSLI